MVSKYEEISPSMTQKNFFRSVVLHWIYRMASMVRRFGRNPKEY